MISPLSASTSWLASIELSPIDSLDKTFTCSSTLVVARMSRISFLPSFSTASFPNDTDDDWHCQSNSINNTVTSGNHLAGACLNWTGCQAWAFSNHAANLPRAFQILSSLARIPVLRCRWSHSMQARLFEGRLHADVVEPRPSGMSCRSWLLAIRRLYPGAGRLGMSMDMGMDLQR